MRYIVIIICMFLQGCSSAATSQVCIKQHCFNVEVLQKQEDLFKGLQFRESMPQDHGMLFIFPHTSKHSFWMKDTLIPLDMIWFDYSRRIVDIVHQVQPCKADPCPSYTPVADAMYVLEINSGLANQLGIKQGDVATFTVPGTYNH